LVAVVLALTCAAPAHSQDQGGELPITNGSPSQKMDAGQSNKQMEQYRHSSAVQALGRLLHVSAERAAMIFEDFNSGVLIFAIGYGLFKYLPGAFKTRREKIERDLADARSATELANERLKAVEARLAGLDKDIEAIRQHAAHDSAMDQKRIEESLEAERARIVRSAEQEIAAAQAAAQRELKRFAANLAVDRAISRVQLSAEDDQTLVRDFTENLDSMLRSGDFARRGRN
jgi:F-type H+-transporting ATPase subunit b